MEVFEFGNRSSEVVLIQMIDKQGLELIENELVSIHKRTDIDFLLRAFKVKDWNKDLSPWEAPAVFGRDDFGGGADNTLAEILRSCSDNSMVYYIGGYSLAGLFALWCAYQTDVFSGVASASPSIWFPGFTDYMKEHTIKSGCVYLSLGNNEAKSRNPVMASVGRKIQEAYSVLNDHNIKCTMEWNEGNHFKDTDIRTAKAFSWVINQSIR